MAATSPAAQKQLEKKVWGDEPTLIHTDELSQLDLARCLAWYNAICDMSDAREYLYTYLKDSNDPRLFKVKKATDTDFRSVAGWIARILTRGGQIPVVSHETFNRLVDKIAYSKPEIPVVKAEDLTDTNLVIKSSVQQRTLDKAGELIADVEEIVDNWENHSGFSFYQHLTKHSVPPKIVGQIVSYYEPLAAELNIASSLKGDKDIKEAYAYLGRKRLAAYRLFVNALLDDAKRYTDATKKAKPRKTRKKTTKTPEQRFQHLKIGKECLEFKVRSIDPSNFIGKSQLWVFDTKYKTLTQYVADSDRGLELHRSTLKGFDPKKSVKKKIGRNTQKMIDSVMRGTKTQAAKVFNQLKSDPVEVSGRLNENQILLRVF